jgi:hypothetical protein
LQGDDDDAQLECRPSWPGDWGDFGGGVDARGGAAVQDWDFDGGKLVPALSGDGRDGCRKQGQPSRSRLDPHEAFILALIEATPDITLTEIAERLTEERGVRVVPSTVWMFLDKRRFTFKKDSACQRAATAGCKGPPSRLVRRPARSRPFEADLHRRDVRIDEDGEVAWPGEKRRTLPRVGSPRALSRRGSLIVVDNVVGEGAIVDVMSRDRNVQGMRRFYELIAAEPRVSATALQTVGSKGYDGFAIALVTGDPEPVET